MLEQIKSKAIELLPRAKALAPKALLWSPVPLLGIFIGIIATSGKPADPPVQSVTIELPPARPFVPGSNNTPVIASQQVVQTETKIVYVTVPAQNGQPATTKAVEVQAPINTPVTVPALAPAPVLTDPSASPQLSQIFTQPALPPKPAPRKVVVTPVQYINGTKLQPDYPDDLRTAGIEGTVRVQVTVGPDGRPTGIRTEGKVDPRLAVYVQKFGMKNWRFKPATVDGMPGTGNIDISLAFKLTQG